MSIEDAKAACAKFFPPDEDEYDEEDYEDEEDEYEDDELNESLLDDITSEDNTESAVSRISKDVDTKQGRKNSYRNTISIELNTIISGAEHLIHVDGDQLDMQTGNAADINRFFDIRRCICDINRRLCDFLDVCESVDSYSVTFIQAGKNTHPHDLVSGRLGDAYFSYNPNATWSDYIHIEIGLDNDDMRGSQVWRFIKGLYSCAGRSDDKMDPKCVLYPISMNIRRGPYSDYYGNTKFYGMYINDSSTDKMKFSAVATFCWRLGNKQQKTFRQYLRRCDCLMTFGEEVAWTYANQARENRTLKAEGLMEGLLDNYGMTFREIIMYDPTWNGNTVFIQDMLGNRSPNCSHDSITRENMTENFWRWVQSERPAYLLNVQVSAKTGVNVQLVFYGTTCLMYGFEYVLVVRQSFHKYEYAGQFARCLRVISFATGRPIEDIVNDRKLFTKSTLNAFSTLTGDALGRAVADAKEKDFTTFEL